MNEDFFEALQRFSDQLPKTISDVVSELGEIGTQAAQNTDLFKNNGPLKRATGFIRNGEWSGKVLANKPYAYYLEYGNDPGGGFIFPKNAKALRFKINGETIFAKKVKAHGPLPFMDKARKTVINRVPGVVEYQLSQLIKGIK